MKTIWILNHYALSPDLPGGTRHFDIASQLVEQGDRVVIFAAGFHHGRYVDLKLSPGQPWKTESFDGVQFVWLRTVAYRRNDWRRYLNMISYMRRALWLGRRAGRRVPSIPKPDIVIGSSVHLLAVLAAYRLAKYHRARFIMEVRDLWPQTFIDMGKMSPRHPVVVALKGLERFLYRRAQRIIILPPFADRYIAGLGIAKEKIAWIPNGVDLRRFSPGVDSKSEHQPFTAMYIGSFGETNGVEAILQSAILLKDQSALDIHFHLVGDGPEKENLLRMKEAFGLDRVAFFEPVPKRDIPKILARADVLIHVEKDIPALSQYGSSPNKFYDYLASGKPLIVSSPFITDPIEDIGCGIRVDPNDAQAMAQALMRLFRSSEDERRRMGRQGRAYVEKNFAMPVIIDRLKTALFSG